MLNYLIVDDETKSCNDLAYELEQILPKESEILVANSAAEAIAIANKYRIFVAFLDINMPGMNGFALAKVFEEQRLSRNVIFATAHPNYSLEAWNTQASGFLVKPVRQAQLESCLKRLRDPIYEVKSDDKEDMLQFKCFGNFEVTFQGKPLQFTHRKCKDFLAYLIDRRGTMVSSEALRAVLWDRIENTDRKAAYIRVMASDIRLALTDIGQNQVFLHERDMYGLDVSKLKCDYYDYLANDAAARRTFHGEYMNQYAWARVTLISLLENKDI